MVAEQLKVPVELVVGAQSVTVVGDASFVSHTTESFSPGAKCEPLMVTWVPFGPEVGDTDIGGRARKKLVAASRPDVVPVAMIECGPSGPRFAVAMFPTQLNLELVLTTALQTASADGEASLVR